MPTDKSSMDASRAQTDWNTFMNNFQSRSLRANALNMGKALGPMLQNYEAQAQSTMGQLGTSIGKRGNFQFDAGVATGQTATTRVGLIQSALEGIGAGSGMDAITTMGDDVDSRISELQGLIDGTDERLAPYNTEYLAGKEQLAALGFDSSLSDTDLINAVNARIQEINDSLSGPSVDDRIKDLNDRLRRVGDRDDLGLIERQERKQRIRDEIAALEAGGTPDAEALWEERQRLADTSAEMRKNLQALDAARQELAGTEQNLSTEVKSLQDVAATIERVMTDANEILDTVLGPLDENGNRSGGTANNNPLVANASLQLTSGSTAQNSSAVLTKMEIGRQNMINNTVADMVNLIGQAAMADDAAAFSEEMGAYERDAIRYQQAQQSFQYVMTGVNLGLNIIGLGMSI